MRSQADGEHYVVPGDKIVEVNGEAAGAQGLARALTERSDVTLRVLPSASVAQVVTLAQPASEGPWGPDSEDSGSLFGAPVSAAAPSWWRPPRVTADVVVAAGLASFGPAVTDGLPSTVTLLSCQSSVGASITKEI
mmetsp:Transcript_12216/g.33392  ORF Transcript_12216/g.33392 Transcript_12216/m.33392 type:complete len:136 (+) Transcript_12216:3-410(+)